MRAPWRLLSSCSRMSCKGTVSGAVAQCGGQVAGGCGAGKLEGHGESTGLRPSTNYGDAPSSDQLARRARWHSREVLVAANRAGAGRSAATPAGSSRTPSLGSASWSGARGTRGRSASLSAAPTPWW
jgi:hypothetical protein